MLKTSSKFFYMLIPCGILAVLISGCAPKKTPQTHTTHTKSSPRTHSVDSRTQQRYYDTGLQYYSKEQYVEAKKAFQHVIEISPNNSLGLKAQQNIKKINQILRTVEEIEKK